MLKHLLNELKSFYLLILGYSLVHRTQRIQKCENNLDFHFRVESLTVFTKFLSSYHKYQIQTKSTENYLTCANSLTWCYHHKVVSVFLWTVSVSRFSTDLVCLSFSWFSGFFSLIVPALYRHESKEGWSQRGLPKQWHICQKFYCSHSDDMLSSVARTKTCSSRFWKHNWRC